MKVKSLCKKGKLGKSLFFRNPLEPANKSIRKKIYLCKENSPLVRADYHITKLPKVIALLHFTQSLFYFPAFFETITKVTIAKMTKRSIAKKRIISPIFT